MIQRYDKHIEEHVAILRELYSDPTAAEFFRRVPRDLVLRRLADFEELFGVGLYVLTCKDGPAGLAVVSDINPYGQNCQLGIAMLKKYRHQLSQGLFKEMCRFIFNTTQIRKIYLTVLERRIDLRHWCAAQGMEVEAWLTENIFFEGAWHTEVMFSVYRNNF